MIGKDSLEASLRSARKHSPSIACGTARHGTARIMYLRVASATRRTSGSQPASKSAIDLRRGALIKSWVEPKVVVEGQFVEWTSDGHLRHPSLLGLRKDKKANDVVRERASAAAIREGDS